MPRAKRCETCGKTLAQCARNGCLRDTENELQAGYSQEGEERLSLEEPSSPPEPLVGFNRRSVIELADLLVVVLRHKLANGEPTASDCNIVRAFLHDMEIELPDKDQHFLDALQDEELPFGGDSDDTLD